MLEPVKVAELRPGCYCEIDMVVPPTASDSSFDCYKGTVKEINHDEVVLTDVLEESCVEYGTSARRRSPAQQKREVVHVPLTGVDTIWALPPAKDDAARTPPSKPSALPLPSSSARAALPPAASSPAADAGSPPGASRFPSPPLPESTAHFDAPPAGNAVR